jgi:ribonuclease HI
MHARAYTDGSTGPTPGVPSGCSVVVVLCGTVVNIHGFPCRASGNNYLAEMIALLAALQAVPSNVPLSVHSDCLAGILSANKRRCRDWARGVFLDEYALPQRRRILSAARPVLNGIRAAIRCRDAPTRLEFVRAHTGASNQHALMNQRADEEANRARRENTAAKLPLHLYGEERHCMALRRIPVIGAFKPAILRYLSTRSISRWCGIPSKSPVVGADLPPLFPAVAHSARLVSAHRAAVIAMSGTVSRSRDPHLLRFWLLAVTEWLPVERRLVRSHRAGMPPRGHGCKLCGAAVETVRHVFVCPRRELMCERDNSIGCALRVLSVAGIRARSGMRIHPAPPVPVTVDDAKCTVRWVPAWFDLSGRSWLEVCVFADDYATRDTEVDALAAVLGIMPENVSALFAHGRLPSGAWSRRPLRDVSAVVGSLQEELLRGALSLWKARCRAPAAEPAVRARASQVHEGHDRDSSHLAQATEKRRHSAYVVRMAKKKAKREAKSLAPLSPPCRFSPPTSVLSPGEPDPVDRPGDWLGWKSALLVAAGSGRISAAQGLSLANSCLMARIAEVTGSVRTRRQTDHGPQMVSQGEGPDPVPVTRSVALPWF